MPTLNANNCTPRLVHVDQSTGCTLTRASIKGFTGADMELDEWKETGLARIIANTKEARMAGVPENSLTDLLLSRHVPLPQTTVRTQGSIIQPFSLVPRRTIVNANYFNVEANAAHAGAGTTHHTGARKLTVNLGSSPYKTNLPNIERYFLPGRYIHIASVDANGNATSTVWKILGGTDAPATAGTGKAYVTVQPNLSAAGYTALTDKAPYQLATGLVVILANSVSDYESHAQQYPAENPLGLLEYWQQTVRWSHAYNDEYLKALQAPHTSEWFRKFRQLPLAKQRKLQESLNEREFFNMVFYGERINEFQTQAKWNSTTSGEGLDQVTDPANSNCLLEYKANTLGIRTQINECSGRLADMAGGPLNIDTIMETCYQLKRQREATGGSIDTIDCMTDRFTASLIRDVMMRYYKSKFGLETNRFWQASQKIEFEGYPMFAYNRYELPDQGVDLAVLTHTYFEDRYAATPTAQKARGRQLLFIDWSDIDIGVCRTNSAKRKTNVADNMYRYVITPNVEHVLLQSKTIEVRVGDANRHAIVENFSLEAPVLTVPGITLTQEV